MTSVPSAKQIDNVAPADSLYAGTVKYNAHWHDYEAVLLTNGTGAQVVAGDVVAVSTSADASTALADVAGEVGRTFVVAAATIAAAATGEYAVAGHVQDVRAQGSIARGRYVRKSATTLAVEDAGTAVAAGVVRPPGAVGFATSAAAAGVVDVYWFGQPSGGGGQMTRCINVQQEIFATTGYSLDLTATANQAICLPFPTQETFTLRRIVLWNGATVSGNLDAGIYDAADGTRKVSMGSTAASGTSTSQILDVADTTLPPGDYYAAVAADNAIHQFGAITHPNSITGIMYGEKTQASAFALPATLGTLADSAATATPGITLLGHTATGYN